MDPLRILHPDIDPPALAPREWLVANGLGGYACGTVSGPPIRRYHGLLIAALPPPLGRVIMVNRLIETVHCVDGRSFGLGAGRDEDCIATEFRLESGLPVWRWQTPDDSVIERAVVMAHGENRTYIRWTLLQGAPVTLHVEPWVQMRPHGNPVDSAPAWGHSSVFGSGLCVECPDYPVLHLSTPTPGAAAAIDDRSAQIYYPNEAEGGDPSLGPQWNPGHVTLPLHPDRPAMLCVSADDAPDWIGDPWQAEKDRRRDLIARAHPALRRGIAAELVLTADSFVITPIHRGGSDRQKSILAGYHWFSDWGRDTMIALEGLTLAVGRAELAGPVLESFAVHMRDGLIPNMFPDGRSQGEYNTADAGLWFFHATDRVVEATGDMDLLKRLMPVLTEMIERHRAGTRFGIAMDPDDALMIQGEAGRQLTWMDAKIDDWVVTPRRGKAVEINALWYNALCCMVRWRRMLGRNCDDLEQLAGRVRQSFNRRFWSDELGYLYDVVDGPDGGPDASLRPNQVFAISLPHAVLDESHWPAVTDVLRQELLTPFGLRSLAPGDPEYKPCFFGDRWARDGAYHQGTVWAWLIGPFLNAWLKTHPDGAEFAQACLDGFAGHLSDFGMGSIAEVFDADYPHTPRGCVSQAWSVAEWLRIRTLL